MTVLFGAWLVFNVVMFLVSFYLILFGISTYKSRKGLTIILIILGLYGTLRAIIQLTIVIN